MDVLFMLCAVVGGTILLLQFVLTMLGFLHFATDVGDDISLDGGDAADGSHHPDHGAAAWLWGVVSFRTLTAAATFFGLFGIAMRSSGASPSLQISTALVAGLGAMYAVHGMMRGMQKLAQDNTIQIKRSIGKIGTVYLTIPGNISGTGKIHITVQGRLEEFEATTPSRDKLLPGARVVVIGVGPAETLVVEPVDVDAEPTQELARSV